jgi:GNAT superfamily N-acetyltransferase
MPQFRKMTAADIDAAFRIRTSTTENALSLQDLEEDYGLTPQTLATALQGSASGWVCEVDAQVVGFAMGDSEAGELTVIAVLAEHEGNGIGRRLLAEVESWLFGLGHEAIWLVTSPDPSFRAYQLYLSQGWRATGVIIEEDEKFVKARLQ